MDEKTYMELLDRAYKMVSPRVQRRSEIPKLRVQQVGRKTVVANFNEVVERLNRDPAHIAKFFMRELAIPGTIEGSSLVLHGEKSPRILEAVYERYIKYYVVCPVCNSIDTELRKEGRIYVMKCTACGATSPVRPL